MMRVVALVLTSMAVVVGGCQRGQPTDIELQSSAASALLGQFDTVMYETADLVSDSGPYNRLPEQDAKILRFPFVYLRNALRSLETQADSVLLANSDAVLVGAKDFRPPSGLGAVRSVRCYVAVLRDGNNFELRKHFHESPTGNINAMPIWNWSAGLSEFGENDPRSSSLYATQVGDSYLLVANDVKELQIIAEQLSSPKHSVSPLALSEWTLMSRHKMWGYRRYNEVASFDRMAAGMHNVTSSAEALIFYLNSTSESGVLRVMASDASTIDKMNAEMISKGTTTWPSLKPAGHGVWETTIQFSGDAGSLERGSFVIGLLGFAVYP